MRVTFFASSSFLLVTLLASASFGQVQRTFVSGLGMDGNPCSRTAPCRTFSQAISQTNAGGEVVVLDSAGYGPFTITKAVTVQAAPGVYAGISVFSGDGIAINTSQSDTVILRGLTINNQGSTGNGISFRNQGELHVENCAVRGFSGGEGLVFVPAGGLGTLEVKDSIFRGNNNGIRLISGSAAIEQVLLESDTLAGLLVEVGARAAIRNSLVSECKFGLVAFSNTSSDVDLEMESCSAVDNLDGVVAQSTSTGVATVRISNSTVTHNGSGLVNAGSPAVLLSRGNNTVEANGTDIDGKIATYSAK
jgi:hypothetical protein